MKTHTKTKFHILGFAVCCLSLVTARVQGQTTPVDLTELGLEEILTMSIVPQSALIESERHGFRLGYQYVRVNFEQYLSGRDKVSRQQVLANFPVVPADITQQAHIVTVGYEFNDRFSVNLNLPQVHQSTYHISRVPGYGEFTIDSSGLGDISLSAAYIAWRDDTRILAVDGGFSLPTGSIDELGNTPRTPGLDQLPYTMQLGSGTVDFQPGVTFAGAAGNIEYGARLQGTVRMGRNDRDYSLSHRAVLKSWVTYTGWKYFHPSFKVSGQVWDRIHGQDSELLLPPGAPVTFPAPVTNPRLFGGEKIALMIGGRIPFSEGYLKGQSIEVEAGLPVYQRLNGPQPGETWRLAVSWNWSI